jgi:hypothetical protein
LFLFFVFAEAEAAAEAVEAEAAAVEQVAEVQPMTSVLFSRRLKRSLRDRSCRLDLDRPLSCG